MDIIRNNPYRVLGVLANASRKDIERNKSQIKAFAKVGRTPSFPYDFENVLGKVERTEECLNDAVSKLTFDKDKVAYGLFWFCANTFMDEEMLRNLASTNLDFSISYLCTYGTQEYSTYINLGCLSLIKGSWSNAAYCFVRLFDSLEMWNKYIESICDQPQNISYEEELEKFVDTLISNFPIVNWLDVFHSTNFTTTDEDRQCTIELKHSQIFSYLLPKYQNKVIAAIDELLKEASGIDRTDAIANLSMAAKLEQSCKELLATLKSTLDEDDRTYTRYADKVALQTLDNCVYYFNNDQGNPACPKNVLRHVRFCVKIAEGQLAKDRCKKNFDVIKEAYDDMCPQEVLEEVAFIVGQMKKSFNSYAITGNYEFWNSLRASSEKLTQIKRKIGENERYYWRLSERLILFYFNNIIDFVNNAMKAFESVQSINYYIELDRLHTLLKKCKPILNELESFPKKDPDCISFFNKNYQKFKEIYLDYHVDGDYNSQTYSQPVNPCPSVSGNQRRTTGYSSQNSNSSNNANNKARTGIKWAKPEKWLMGIAGVILCIMLTSLCITISNAPVPKKSVQSINCNTEPRTYLNTDNSDDASGKEETEAQSEPYEVTYFNTGDMPYRNIFGKGKYDKRTKNYLEIDNGGDTDAVVFLETLDGRKIRHAYICKNEKYRMKHIPAGKYIVKIMQGNSWNSQKDTGSGPLGGFMENVSYSKSESYDPFEYPSYASGKWGWYSITLYKTPDGNMSTQPISEGEFF